MLMAKGEYDGISSLDDLNDFFKQLPNGGPTARDHRRRGARHHASLNRAAFWHTMHGFLTMPQPAEA